MASFDSAQFKEAPAGDGYPAWNARMLGVVKPLPAGYAPVWKEIGEDVQRASVAAQVTRAELTALYDKVLETGSLVMDWGTSSAFLENVGAPSRVGLEDLWLVTLDFVRL